MAEQFVLLWSKAKNEIDVRPLEAYLSANRAAYKDDRVEGDFVPLYVGERGLVAACAGHCSVTLMGREIKTIEDAHAAAADHLQTRAHLEPTVG